MTNSAVTAIRTHRWHVVMLVKNSRFYRRFIQPKIARLLHRWRTRSMHVAHGEQRSSQNVSTVYESNELQNDDNTTTRSQMHAPEDTFERLRQEYADMLTVISDELGAQCSDLADYNTLMCSQVHELRERRASAQAEYMCTLDRLNACLPELDAHLHAIHGNAKAAMRRPRSASAVIGTMVAYTADDDHA